MDTRDNGRGEFATVLTYQENSTNSLIAEREKRFADLRSVLEHHCAPQVLIIPSAPERILRRLAAELDNSGARAVRKHFDDTAGSGIGIAGGVAMLEKAAARYLPDDAAAR